MSDWKESRNIFGFLNLVCWPEQKYAANWQLQIWHSAIQTRQRWNNLYILQMSWHTPLLLVSCKTWCWNATMFRTEFPHFTKQYSWDKTYRDGKQFFSAYSTDNSSIATCGFPQHWLESTHLYPYCFWKFFSIFNLFPQCQPLRLFLLTNCLH